MTVVAPPATPAPSPAPTPRRVAVAAAEWSDARRLAVVAGQLLPVLWICPALRIESPAFFNIVMPAAVAGAFVHHALPMRWRLPFFALLSVGVTWAVFGPVQGAWLVALAMGLVTVCRLPLSWAARVALLL